MKLNRVVSLILDMIVKCICWGPTMILTRRTTTVGMALLLLCFSIYLHDIFILLLLEPFSWQVIGIYFPQAWVHFHCPIAGFFRVADFSKPKSAMQLVCCVPRQKSAKLKLHASVACQWPTYLHDQLHQKSPNTPSNENFVRWRITLRNA